MVKAINLAMYRILIGLVFFISVNSQAQNIPGILLEYDMNSTNSGTNSPHPWLNDSQKWYIQGNQRYIFGFAGGDYDLSNPCPDRYFVSAECSDGFTNVNGAFHSLTAGPNNTTQRYSNPRVGIDVGSECLGNNKMIFWEMRRESQTDIFGFHYECSEPSPSHRKTINFCVLRESGQPLGTIRSSWPGNVTLETDSPDPAYSSLIWESPTNYCSETVKFIQSRLISYNGIAVTPQEQQWGQWDPLVQIGTTVQFRGGGQVFTKGYGQYLIEARVKDEFGNVFAVQEVPLCFVPGCGNDVPPSVTIPTATIIGGGYPNASTTGAYRLQTGVEYTLNMYGTYTNLQGVVKPEISMFDHYYTVSAKDGNGGTPAAVELIKQSEGIYKVKLNSTLGAYTIQVSSNPIILGPYGTGCNFTCQPFNQPINLLVGGENITPVTRNCLIRLPQDFEDLFGFLPTHYSLNNFIYTVSSKKGIILQPGQTSMRLTAGAHLRLEVSDPEVKPQEIVDNNKNWTQSWIYDESGQVIAESKSFFDARGQATQEQVKNLSDGVVICTQQVPDRFGRMALQTLAAPVRAKMSVNGTDECGDRLPSGGDLFFLYAPDFIGKDNGTYNYTHFDRYLNTSEVWVDKITETLPDAPDNVKPGTLGWYYSANNKASYSGLSTVEGGDQMVQEGVPVTSYPYSRTIFKTDGTGMPKSATLPGDQHHSASQHYSSSDVFAIESSDPDYTADEALIADYLTLYASVFSYSPQPRSNWKIFKSVSQEMPYVDAAGVQQPGNKSIVYIDSDQKTLITSHPASTTHAFAYYDALGRSVCNITPKGVEQWKAGVPFVDIDKTTIRYNSKGQVVEMTEKDAGTTRFMYRKDGALRYTQNAEQAMTGKFSYVLYDQAGREIEAGVFLPSSGSTYTFGSIGLKGTLDYNADNTSNSDLHLGGTKLEVNTTSYDEALLAEQVYTTGNIVKVSKDNGTATYFSYDDRDRVVWTRQDIPGLGSKIITYKYATNSQLKEVAYQPGDANESFYHYYGYDLDARLVEVQVGRQAPVYDINDMNLLAEGFTMKQVSAYSYYLHGPLKSEQVGPEELNYLYTIQGWLKGINAQRLSDSQAKGFSLALDYYNGDYIGASGAINGNGGNTGAVTKFDGLIRSQTWRTEKPNGAALQDETYAYQYLYDNRNQLSSAQWGKVVNGVYTSQGNVFKEGELTYDANGNIRTLARYNEAGGLLHDFTGSNQFVYEGVSPIYPKGLSNKLSEVPGYSTYNYNNIGQLTAQTFLASNIGRSFTYNADGLVTGIASNSLPLVNYHYDASGTQFKKENHNTSGLVNRNTYYVHDINGNVLAIYKQDPIDPTPVLEEYSLYGSERIGQYRREGNQFAYVYELKDHLGSVRAMLWQNENETEAELFSYSDYYPYGLRQRTYNDLIYRYGYQGQYSEYESETGLNHFELRDYDPVVGRWLGPDPMREFYSAYVGMGNNPVSKTDPDGGDSQDWYKNEQTGKYEWYEGNQDLSAYGLTWVGDINYAPPYYQIDKSTLPANFTYNASFTDKGLFFDSEEIVSFTRQNGKPVLPEIKSQQVVNGVVLNLPIGPGGAAKGLKWLADMSKNKANVETGIKVVGNFVKYTAKVPAANGNGSYTIYAKVLNYEGKTVKWFHDTYDKTGAFLHRGLPDKVHTWWDGVKTLGTKGYSPR